MAEDIKGLINKIQQEGIQAAEDKSRAIEEQARQESEQIINQARSQAQAILAQAKSEIAKMQESSQSVLRQAGRDLLLSLRTELNQLLKKVIASSLRAALTPQELRQIIFELIKETAAHKNEIVILLAPADLKKIEYGFFSKLSGELKKNITLKPSGEIAAGFMISYDNEKSHFDFSDQALAEYLSLHLSSQLAELLQTETDQTKLKKNK